MQLIRSDREWQEFKVEFAAERGWSADLVEWPPAPIRFPLLVMTYSPHTLKVLCGYVHLTDAVRLAQAAGYTVQLPLATDPAAETPRGLPQTEINRYLFANLLAVWQVIGEGEVGRPETREDVAKLVDYYLSVVDQHDAADTERRASIDHTLVNAPKGILDRMKRKEADDGQ